MNLPPNIYNRYLQGPGNSKPAEKYSTVNPFRKVEGIGQYGNGLNASASQLYEHFSGNQHAKGRKYWEHGLKPINPKAHIQSAQEFAQRFNPAPQPQQVVPPPQAPTSNGYQGVVPDINLGGFNPANGIFNMQPFQNPQISQMQAQTQQMNRPMLMPTGGPNVGQPVQQPAVTRAPVGGAGGQSGFENYKATGQLPVVGGIFNLPQFNRR